MRRSKAYYGVINRIANTYLEHYLTAQKHITILVVEDDHDTRVALRSCLEEEGHTVISAANGFDALEILKSKVAPDLIILDIHMPILNGDEFMARIKADEKLAIIPVIQISASTHEKREGTIAALRKPFDPNKLLKVIDSCLTPKKSSVSCPES